MFTTLQRACCAEPGMLHAGILEYLFRLHKWPSGLERKDGKWLMHALHLLSNRLTQHAREALGLGIAPEDHVRSICAVPG